MLFVVFALHRAFVSAQTFHYLKNPLGVVHSSVLHANGTLYVGASSVYSSGDSGNSWLRVGLSTLGGMPVYALTFTRDGKLVACPEQGGIKILQNGNIWTPFNSGLPKGGGVNLLPNIRAITCDSAGHFFAGTRSGNFAPLGMFYAHDTGAAWIDISAGLPALEVLALATSPTGTVFCSIDGYGVYSYNGSTWSPMNIGLSDLHVHVILFDEAETMYAGTNNGISIFKKNASAWRNIQVSTTVMPVLSLAIDPTQKGRIFAGLGHTQYQVGSLYGKIFVSNDSGTTWSDSSPATKTLRVRSLAITPGGTVIAGAQGLFRSTNHGAVWNTSNNGLKEAIPAIVGGGIAVTKNNHFIEGSEYGLWKSTDLGQTWLLASNGIRHPLIEFVFCDSLGYLFACAHSLPRHESSVNRLYRSTDDGETWDTVKVSFDAIYSLIAQGFNNDLYLAHGFGAQPPSASIIGSSCAKSTDRGATWFDLPCLGGGKGFAVGVTKQATVLFGGESLGLFRSTDDGASWDTTIHVGPGGNMFPIAISPRGDIFTCSYGTNHIWFSDSAADGAFYTNMTSSTFPLYTTANSFLWSSTGRMYLGVKGNPPNTGMYFTDGQYSSQTVFTAVPHLYFNVTKMFWDDDGYMWIYGSGSLAKSDSVLTAPKIITAVPVELAPFTATVNRNTVVLKWSTATEVNNYGFEIELRTTPQSPPLQGGDDREGWIKAGFVVGNGTTNAPKEYSFTDINRFPGKYWYRLKQIDRDGTFENSRYIEVIVGSMPTVFALEQNYPNPFNPSTIINYQLPVQSFVTLRVYDAIGRVVATLVHEEKEAGYYTVQFNASMLSSGIYIAQIQSNAKQLLRKMLFLK